jgi:hypothetical protein
VSQTRAAGTAVSDQPLLSELQADKAQNAGLTGKGIKVGVMSDGAYDLSAVENDGNLPKVTVVGGSAGKNSSEGVGMLELVHQIAPDAQLYYCDYKPMPICVQEMVQNYGVNIVVDDISQDTVYFAPSSFSFMYDQLLATYPQLVLVHAAGNFYQYNNYNPWTPTNVSVGGTTYAVQDYGKVVGKGSSPYQTFTVPSHSSLRVGMEWSDYPALPTPATDNVMGVWVMDSHNNVLASDTGNVATGQVETTYTNNGSSNVNVRVAAGLVTQNNTDTQAILVWSDSAMSMPSPGGAGSEFGTSQETISVGASDLGTNQIGDFSDEGPFLQWWSATQSGIDSNGVATLNYTRLSSLVQNRKPDLTGIDCDVIDAPDGFKGINGSFCGTSAAAPTVAGVFALVMQASGNSVTRASLVNAVEGSAKHVVSGVKTGNWDGADGYGVVQAWDAASGYIAPFAIPTPKIISPSSNRVTADTGTPVPFSGSCSVKSGSITGYSWDFGDGTAKSASSSPGKHVYSSPGTYTASFNCSASSGFSSPTPAEVTVVVSQAATPAKSGGGGLDLLMLLVLTIALVRRASGLWALGKSH